MSKETESVAVKTSLDFKPFKRAIAAQLERMKPHGLYVAGVSGDALWEKYLSSFPPGSDPIYEKRTEHDCACCRSFVKRAGAIVALVDGRVETIWDFTAEVDPAYRVVADSLSALVRGAEVAGPYMTYEPTVGTEKSFDQVVGKTVTYEHFFTRVPSVCVFPKPPKAKTKKLGEAPAPDSIETKRSEARANKDVLLRSLREITRDAVDTVLDLISQNSLYRGEENQFAVKGFQELQTAFAAKPVEMQDWFAWTRSAVAPGSVARIRNTAIGTLLVDLSEGKEVDAAVRAFEAVVAPANYKRPTALVTKAQVARAKDTIAALGLTSALERRYATIDDVTVADLLFADRDARAPAVVDVFDAVNDGIKDRMSKRVEEVTIEKFLSDVLPRTKTLEVLLENRHAANLVALVAPVDPGAAKLFKWGNGFSWSYAGEVADSDIRSAVRAKGGRVDGAFRFSHSWNHEKRNASLMDLHVFMPGSKVEPTNGVHDSYGNDARVGWNHRNHHASGGTQDVDYTQAAPEGYVPVENTTWPDIRRMPEGRYICKIHNWNLRQPTQGGFRAEIEFAGQVYEYEYDRPLGNKEWVTVAEVYLKDGEFSIKHHLPHGESQQVKWGLATQKFHRVSAVMLSPNHWSGAVGNRHFFFALRDCKAEGKVRGFYNEFLREDLSAHRKVLEVVGSKVRTEESDRQLSGLGFSSTQRNSVTVRLGGALTRQVKVTF